VGDRGPAGPPGSPGDKGDPGEDGQPVSGHLFHSNWNIYKKKLVIIPAIKLTKILFSKYS
jgi:hypothetical protein